MTDKNEFSFDFAVTPTPGFEPSPDLLAFDLCKPYSVPGGNLLLHNTWSGKRAMLKPEVYASLVACNEFQTLDTHIENIIQRQPALQGQQADIRGVLTTMLKNGIMRSAKDVIGDIRTLSPSHVDTVTDEKPVVVIMAWERPQALERLLTSIVSNCASENIHCLYVIDDSRKPDNIKQIQAVVSKFVPRLDTPLHYFGQSEQQAYIRRLAARLPEYEPAIRFLIDQNLWTDHWTCGLARNWGMFLSFGRRLVVMDDDTICDVYNPPELKPDITVADTQREVAFFADETQWVHLRQAINPDPIDRHMQCLGLTLSEAIAVFGEKNLKPSGLQHATSLLANELEPDSLVLVTQCGLLGCPGTNNNTLLPGLTEQSLERMLASEERTAYALNTRKVWSGRNNPHFTPHSNMSQIVGLDNRQMLPPYFPITRGEDRLFGHMVNFVFPTSVSIDYPWASPHLPIPERRWSEEDMKFKPFLSFPLFFFEEVLGQKTDCHSVQPNDRLARLAAWFRDLGGTSHKALVAMYRDHTLTNLTARIKRLEDLLAEAESTPVDWQNYLRNGLEKLSAGLDTASREDMPVNGIPATLEGESLSVFWNETWNGFAEVLDAWPAIRLAATELVETGIVD